MKVFYIGTIDTKGLLWLMNKVIICFRLMWCEEYYEIKMDSRLSIVDNLKLLKDDNPVDAYEKRYYICHGVALKKDVPLLKFDLPQYTRLLVY